MTGFPTPGLVGSAYSGTLMADEFTDTGVALPSSGWIRLIGSIAAGSGFSVVIPVSLIDDLTEDAAGSDPADDTAVRFSAAPGMSVFLNVYFGHNAAGNILMADHAGGAATLSVYEE